jgi:hypothetical protein
MSKITIGITGHRLLSHSQTERIKPVIKRAIENIIFMAGEEDESVTFSALSPLAEGADTIFAKAALELDLPLKVILPFEPERYLVDFTTEQSKREFDTLYSGVAAEDKSILNSYGGQEYNQLFLLLGQRVVDDSDYLIAVWNEKEGNGKGGTADVVAYAMERKKSILLINPETGHAYINFLHTDNYKDFKKKESDAVSGPDHLLNYIASKQQEYNNKAMFYNGKYIGIWTSSFVLGIVEVFMFSLSISYHLSPLVNFIVSSLEALCLFIIILLILFGQSRKWHYNYLHNRIISERLRIKRFFCEFGFRIYAVSVSPIYFSFKEKPEYNILDSAIKSINLSAYTDAPFEQKKQRLLSELIIDQEKYHERKKEKFEKRNNLYKQLRKYMIFAFIIATFVHYFDVANTYFLHIGVHASSYYPSLLHNEFFENTLLFLTVFVPPMIAASEALKYLYEWEKIITISASMAEYFRKRAARLKHVHSEAELEAFLNSINKDMLIENLDWEKYMQDKNDVPT